MPVGSVSVPAPVFTMSVYLPKPLPSSAIDVMIWFWSDETGKVTVPPVR